MDGRIDPEFAGAVGSNLATIHARSADDAALRALFANDATFEAIRIEPYLRATARVHADLAPRLEALAGATLGTKRALVHGDVSPKNILHGPQGPVFLDAECAWYGDPAFDLAFCLNHLLLKGARTGADRTGYVAAFAALVERLPGRRDLGGRRRSRGPRSCALLPALFLARVDGKSPVEYLTGEAEKDAVRRHARSWIARPARRLARHRRSLDPGLMMEPAISKVHARRIWDSRGRPTVEAEVTLSDGTIAQGHRAGRRLAGVAARRSTKRDGGDRFGGLDVQGALGSIRQEIASGAARLRPVRSGGCRRLPDRARRHPDQGSASAATPPSRSRWRCCTPPRRAAGCRSGAISAARRRGRSRCPRSRSSAAAPMRAGVPTCRTSW